MYYALNNVAVLGVPTYFLPQRRGVHSTEELGNDIEAKSTVGYSKGT